MLELRIAKENQMREFLGQGPWRPHQPHSRLTQQPVAFPTVAAATGDHLVFPAVGSPAAGRRHHVVDRQLRRRHPLAAVLARAVVAEEEVSPIGAQHPSRDLDVREESNDDHVLAKAPQGDCLLDRLPRNLVDKGDTLLREQDDKPPLTDDVQRLE